MLTSRARPLIGFGVLLASLFILAACIEVTIIEQPDSDDVTPEPTPTNDVGDETPEPTPASTPPTNGVEFSYELLASEKTLPPETFQDVIELAENPSEFETLWGDFGFDDSLPEVDWDRQVVLFFGTGESGTCPLQLMDVRFDPEERLVTAEIDEDLPPDAVCTSDWTPRTFAVAVSAEPLDESELFVQFFHPDRGAYAPGEDDRVQVRE